jgi:hypothetical protein
VPHTDIVGNSFGLSVVHEVIRIVIDEVTWKVFWQFVQMEFLLEFFKFFENLNSFVRASESIL